MSMKTSIVTADSFLDPVDACRSIGTMGKGVEKEGYLQPEKTRYSTCTWVYQW
jgi:hypothetical protein